MVIDRVNCMRYVFTSVEVRTPYKLTTFFVYCSGFPWKNVLPIEMGRGDLLMVKWRAQKK